MSSRTKSGGVVRAAVIALLSGELYSETNDNSVAILLTYGTARVLLADDAEAVNAVVATALGSAIPLLLYSLPGIRQLQDFIYYLVASNRNLLPGDQPYCAQHPAECR